MMWAFLFTEENEICLQWAFQWYHHLSLYNFSTAFFCAVKRAEEDRLFHFFDKKRCFLYQKAIQQISDMAEGDGTRKEVSLQQTKVTKEPQLDYCTLTE